MENKPLLQRLIDAGYPKEDIDHHESDLYVYVDELTTRVITEWCGENGFSVKWNCPIFHDNLTGKAMYDCVGQYYKLG